METLGRQYSGLRAHNIARAEGWRSLVDFLSDRWFPSLRAIITTGCSSMRDISNWVDRHGEYEVWSFDVFDTLLRRRIDPPDLVKRLVAEHMSEILVMQGINISPDEILARRAEAEEALRQDSASKGTDAQCYLDEVITETLRRINANNLLHYNEIVTYEIGLEKIATEPMPGAVEATAHLKSLGKRVVGTSETYLSLNQIAALLEHHGLLQYIDKLYISSDSGRSKASGRLFKYIIEKERGGIVHVGDDYFLDKKVPENLGIVTLWFQSRSELRRKSELRRLFSGKNKLDYANAVIGRDDENKSPLYRIGHDVLGPALTIFVHNVAVQAEKDGVEALFFVARDGYVMKKIYETLQRSIYAEHALPPGKYLCLGRLPVRLASLHELTYVEIMEVYEYIARLPGRSVTMGDISRSYGLEPSSFNSIAKQYGIDWNKPFKQPDQDKRLTELLKSNEFREAVRRKSAETRKLLRDYLDHIGFMGKRKVAVVDANAEGLTQSILDRIFSCDRDYPEVNRYYFNLVTLNLGTNLDLSRVKGIVGDWRSDSEREQEAFRLFGLLIELFSHPNHGVTVGYKRVANRIVPIFRKTPQESQYHLTSQVLRGILSYAKEYGTFYRLHNFACTQLLGDMKSNVKQWLFHPPKIDAQALKDSIFTSDWPIETNHRLVEQVNAWDIMTILGLRKKVATSAWPEATLAVSPASSFSRLLYLATTHCVHE